MPIKVNTPDGGVANFPDGTPVETIEAAMRQKFGGKAPVTAADVEAKYQSAAGRFSEGLLSNINPINIAKGLYGAVTDPAGTVRNIGSAMGNEWEKAGLAASEGRYSEAVGHGAAGSIPIVGPAAASAAERMGSGDVAGGTGEATGLLLPFVGPRGVEAGLRAARGSGVAEDVAGALERGAAGKVADVMSPKVGAAKVRFGNTAEKVAPQLVRDLAADGAPLTRGGFHAEIRGRLADAEKALDAASDARLTGRTFPVDTIIRDLEKARAKLTATSGSGTTIVPAPNSARVAVIDQAIEEIRKMGPQYGPPGAPGVGYDAIRTIRQAYDGQAKVIYNPSMTADFLKAKGAAMGASDVTGVLRDHLAKWDPATAKANAQYSLYRSADDVLKATAEVERTRPRVGRQIMARLTGGILGAQAGPAGAVVGWVGGPILDSAIASGATTQLKTAALMQRLAEAIRTGDLGRVNSVSHQIQRLGMTSAAVEGRQPTGAPAMLPEPVSP